MIIATIVTLDDHHIFRRDKSDGRTETGGRRMTRGRVTPGFTGMFYATPDKTLRYADLTSSGVNTMVTSTTWS